MSLNDPVVRASVLSIYINFVTERGGDAVEFLGSVGLAPDDLSNLERWISLNTVAQLFDLTARRLPDPEFGLNYAMAYPAGDSGLLGHLMLSARTVREMLQVMIEYVHLHSTQMQTALEQHESSYSFLVGYPASFTAPQSQYWSFLMAIVVLRLRRATGADWRPYAVEFAHRRPEDLTGYRRLFGQRLTFDGPKYRIDIDASDLARPMPLVMSRLDESLRNLLHRQLDDLRVQSDIQEQAFAAVSRQLETGQPFNLEEVASIMKLSARQLQWRLEHAGTSYERVLERTRRKLVVRLLRDTDLPIAEIATRLGYSEASPFTRAVRVWFKTTPSAMRRQLRADGPRDTRAHQPEDAD